jgi:hypothetical protein
MVPPKIIEQWMSTQDCLPKLLCAQFESNMAYE